MKKMTRAFALLLTLMLLFSQTAFAENTVTVQDVFDALLTEGSLYSESKKAFAGFSPDIQYEEILDADSFTISVSGSEYMTGSWTFTQEGDSLAASISADDFSGMSLIIYVLRAVTDLHHANASLLNGYISGLDSIGAENPYVQTEADESNGTVKYSIALSPSYDMPELDRMVLDEAALQAFGAESLDEGSISMSMAYGKVYVIFNGSRDSGTILVAEYDGLDDFAYQAIINTAKVFQPEGWEDFVSAYTELKDGQAAGYTVTLNADTAAVHEIIDDLLDGYSYAIVRYGE